MHLRGIGYAFVSSLMFGLGAVLAKLLSGAFDPAVIAVVTLAMGGLLSATLLVLTRKPLFIELGSLNWRARLDLFLMACPGTALPLLVIIAGFARTSALQGGLLQQLNGLAALLFAVLLLGERIRLQQVLGVLFLLLGGVLIVIAGASSASGGDGLGDLLILVGAIGIGFSYIPAKRLAERIDPLSMTAVRLLVGAATIVPLASFRLLIAGHGLLWQPTLTHLAVLLTYVITNFCVAFLAQQAGLRLLKAWHVAAIGQTVPLFATLFAVLLLHESPTPLQGIGGLLAILGGIVVSLSQEARLQVVPAALPPVQEVLQRRQASD